MKRTEPAPAPLEPPRPFDYARTFERAYQAATNPKPDRTRELTRYANSGAP